MSQPAELAVVVLAAGQGKRMRSAQPKVLHSIGGTSMVRRVVDVALSLAASGPVCVVLAPGMDAVRGALADTPVSFAVQSNARGTGDALRSALPALPPAREVLVLYGDVPLVTPALLQPLLDAPPGIAVLTVQLPEPTGYGRILRDAGGAVCGIVEERDATPAQRAIREINTGLMRLPAAPLAEWLASLKPRNAQGEYYLTDVIELAAAAGVPVHGVSTPDARAVQGVNDRAQLAAAERAFQARQADALMRAGLTLLDPARFDLRGTLQHGLDVEIDVNTVLEGAVALDDGVRIGPNCVVRDSRVGAGTQVLGHCTVEGAVIGAGCRIGPYARLRPGTVLADGVHIGNFVEVKASHFGPGAKANHLAYVGDASVGARANLGAGTITCNYDGVSKHRTEIGDDAFIGSNTALVAPVTVGSGATIGAGSVIAGQAPADALTLTRAPKKTVPGWRRPRKQPAGA